MDIYPAYDLHTRHSDTSSTDRYIPENAIISSLIRPAGDKVRVLVLTGSTIGDGVQEQLELEEA